MLLDNSSLLFLSCLIARSQVPEKPKDAKKVKKGKKIKNKEGKASFKHKKVKPGLKLKGKVGSSESSTLKYGDYDLSKLPLEARPDMSRPNLGRHSYTLNFGGTVEVLLSKEAYFVKKLGPNGGGPKGQVSWAKNEGPHAAFEIAKTRAGLERPSA